MKSIGPAAIIIGILLILSGGVAPARAQNAHIQNRIVTQRNAPPSAGREFWFAIPSNYWGVNNGGKSLRVYITSASNTTAYIGTGTNTYTSVPVSAYKITTYDAPEPWEIESSGYVQDNAVHVWSKDADLTVYFMSHNAYTSDGSYIIPTIGWGTDYVVAGFESLYEGSNDIPSEFTIAASTDNTVIEITPACDLRRARGPDSNAAIVAYPSGQTFQITMNRGQSVQFMSVEANSTTGYDVTGTVIHSSEPVGVIGGSMCPNIPADFQYCDHVEHMMPPVRTWGETYYTTSFAQPTGASAGHDSALYLFVASKPNQTIWHYNHITGTQEITTIPTQYGTFWMEMGLTQKFWSDAPFMLVEYMNSASYPDGVNGSGDPAEVAINPREQYTKTVIFETPISVGNITPYTNYATIAVNIKDVDRTTYDGTNILEYSSTSQLIDDTFMVFTVPHISPGTHVVTGDSAGVGVTIYGYGLDESYAWAGTLGLGTFQSPDTVPPVAQISGSCYDAFVHLSDIGGLATKLNKIQADSDYNMTFTLDSNWVEGEELDTASYAMSVIDPSQNGYLHVTAYDVAGNATEITSTYQPNFATISPPVQDFGTVPFTGSALRYDTIRNTGNTPFTISTLKLKLDTEGFTLVNPNMSPLGPDSTRIVEIKFTPKKGAESYDTILFGDECSIQSVVVEGNAGAPDFTVDDQSWINVPLQKDTGWIQLPVVVHNKSSVQDLGVKFDSVSDPIHFYLAPYQKDSVTVPKKLSQSGPDGLDSVWFIYQPTAIEQDGAKGYWHSPDVQNSDGSISVRYDSLHGNPSSASVRSGTSNELSNSLSISNNPFQNSTTVELNLAGNFRADLRVINVLGSTVASVVSTALNAGHYEYPLDTHSWPDGVYFVRLQANDQVITKRIVKVQ